MARKARYKRRSFQNAAGTILIGAAVLVIVAVVLISSVSLLKKVNDYKAREEALVAQIEEEEQRSAEIAEFEKYTHTRKYIEDTARDKLGLVYPGEIVFRNEDK